MIISDQLPAQQDINHLSLLSPSSLTTTLLPNRRERERAASDVASRNHGGLRELAPIHPPFCYSHSMPHSNPSKGPVWSGLTPFQYANMDGKVPLDSSDSDPHYPSSVAPFEELIHASDKIKQEYGLTTDELRAVRPDPNTQYRRASSSSLPQYDRQIASSTPPRSSRYDPVRDAGSSGHSTPSGYAYHYPVHQVAVMTRENALASSSRHSIDFPVGPVAGGSPQPPSARRRRTASNARPRGSQQQPQNADEKAQAEWEQAKANHLAKMKHEQEQAALAWNRNQRMLQHLDVQEQSLIVEGTLIDLWDLASLVEEFRGFYEVSNITSLAFSYRCIQGAHLSLYHFMDNLKVEKNGSWRFIGARIGLPTLRDPNVPMQATPNGTAQLRRLYLEMNERGLEKFVRTEHAAMLHAGQPAPYHGFQPR